MFNNQQQQQQHNSPLDIRNNEHSTNVEAETLDTYHPRVLMRQTKLNNGSLEENSSSPPPPAGNRKSWTNKGHSRWLPRMASNASNNANIKQPQSLKDRLSQKMARLSSLDSTRSSSSVEMNDVFALNDQQQHSNMPLISITSNDSTSQQQPANEKFFTQTNQNQNQSFISSSAVPTVASPPPPPTVTAAAAVAPPPMNLNQRRYNQYNNYYGRSRIGLASNDDDDDDYDEDDNDEFEDSPLPIPYSSSSIAKTKIVNQTNRPNSSSFTLTTTAAATTNDHRTLTKQNSFMQQETSYEDLLDDRQGMNNSEQQFTKSERMNRASIDGSIISELRLDGKKGSSSSKKDKQRRSKSPSSMSMSNLNSRRHRQSRRGFLGLASRLKLTRKHESIAKLQLSILNSGFVSLKTMDRDLQTFLPKERLAPKDFEQRVKLMRKYEVLANIEYRFASRYETYVCRHATQESNEAKNNYKKCIPYDYNRVVLKTLPNVPDSDYINASHVDSLLKPNAYIAAQGPNENTIEDFWRMIWEQKTFVVVMLTKVFDFIRVMCNQYWPVELNKPERYGNLEVTLLYEEPLADFVIRTIRLTKLRNSQQLNGNETNSAQNNVDGTSDNDKKMDSHSHQRARNSDDDDDEEDYDYTEEDTSASEDLLLLGGQDATATASGGGGKNLSIPPVRSPKFVRRRDTEHRHKSLATSSWTARQSARSDSDPNRLSEQHQISNTSDLSAANKGNLQHTRQAPAVEAFDFTESTLVKAQVNNQTRSVSQPPPELAHSSSNNNHHHNAHRRPQPPNEFLHPLFSASSSHHHLATGNSSGSIPSMPSTPLTPHTPSTAGLDRSSATRKAVKKKRRERKKNTRPMRTQFQVPDESQLIDDDDDENQLVNELLTAAGDETPGTAAAPGTAGTKPSERIIYQFHYNSWASHTCPFINSLLHFRRRVRICMDEMSKSGKTGPTVVHCNDGCGRTGTYLCIDANLELAEEDNVYDVFNYTKKMRQSRKFLIENLEQYRFVYDTIEEAMFCGKTWFPVSELHKRLKHKSQRNPLTKKNEYQREYEKITRMTSKFSIGDCAGGHRVENREKNRDVSTVPPDNFRPYLTSFQSNDSTDYINAVFVDGYTRSKEYIVTEWPLHKTISDFWSLIYDHDCNSVILLANPGESSTYPSFLPTEKELRRKFGPVFSAEMVSYTHYQNIKSWIYTINKKIVSLTEVIAGVKSEAKTTQVFQITCWPQGHRVPTSTNALVELMNMVERWRQRTAYGPVCVVSLNGKSRAGVYCAANVAIEQVVQHSEVDVFQAVKTVRRHRPQLIENMTEYKYCYDLILHYVLHYVNQSPTSV